MPSVARGARLEVVSETKALVSVRELEEFRRRAMDRLSAAFEADLIEIEQLERRLAQVRAGTSLSDLEDAVAGLPAFEPEPRSQKPTQPVPRSGLAIAICGGSSRRGAWKVPRRMTAIAIMGGVQIDLREALIGAEGTEIRAFALMGGVEIIVPPGARVECRGIGIAGAFEDRTGPSEPGDETPLIRVTGLALMGGIETRTRKRQHGKEGRRGQERGKRALPSGKDRG